MRYLLDTCTFLWAIAEPERLPVEVAREITEPANAVYLSAVSSWEIAVKSSLGRLPLPDPVETFVPEMRESHGFESLPLEEAATLYLPRLPNVHRDLFDRMLICQAISHGLTLLTPDPEIRRYPVPVRW